MLVILLFARTPLPLAALCSQSDSLGLVTTFDWLHTSWMISIRPTAADVVGKPIYIYVSGEGARRRSRGWCLGL